MADFLTYFAAGPLVGWLVQRQQVQAQHVATAARCLNVIQEIVQTIKTSPDLERTLRLVMDKAAETLPLDAEALFQFDETSQAYRVIISHNLSPEHVNHITFAFDEGVPGWAVKHCQALIIPEAATDNRVHPEVVEDGVKSVLATPLVVRERVIGVLNLYCKMETAAFDDEDRQLAEVFVAQAAVAIENTRLMAEMRQAAVELEARVERRTRQLRQTQTQILRAEKMAVIGRLATSVAHEVNNPLQAIALQLQLITDEGLSEPSNQRLTIVQDELAHIAGIVQRLLDFQRPAPGQRTVQDVSILLDDVLMLVGRQLQQHDITVCRQGDGQLEPILAAGNQLKQIFLNLILNAIEAMPGRNGELSG